MIWIVNSSLIGQSVMSKFCAPASTKPRRNPMTPSPALASPEPVSQADKVTNQVPLRFRVLTSSAVRIPSSSVGGASPRFHALIVELAPANAKPLPRIGFSKNLDKSKSTFNSALCELFGAISDDESADSKNP